MAKGKKTSKNGDEQAVAKSAGDGQATSLRDLAAYVGLSPTALSLVLNDAPASKSIPQETKNRIWAAAAKFNYRPNYFARSLRAQRSFTLGVLVPELSEGYSAMVLSGVEEVLLREGFFYFLASHRHRDKLIVEYQHLFAERRVEGIIAVDTPYHPCVTLPVVTVSGHENRDGITNIVLNHKRAAELALDHLSKLGHRRIAFIKGQEFSSDTNVRWQSIQAAAMERGLKILPSLVVQLEGDMPSPELGYVATRKILAKSDKFTALFAFNDISAIGAIRALHEAGRHVPTDVSVFGFDDIYAAAFHIPALTTIRQPLFEMGRLAAQTLLQKITETNSESRAANEFLPEISIEPELVVRNSTGEAK
ncbi:MAG: LacI family DNA-binding transcriptional regulator [Pyrinomonadaceae bacterium]